MVAFTNYAENESLVPGGAFWITADGKEEQALRYISPFVEQLGGCKIRGEDRTNASFVIAVLKNKLDTLKGRWMLCVDNADDSDSRGVLTEICRLADPSEGWVVVTSRLGTPTLWASMNFEQKLTLKPRSVEMGGFMLWRWKNVKTNTMMTDEKVIAKIESLKQSNFQENKALNSLAGKLGLGGIPLALLQAGSYVQQNNVSFLDYCQIYYEMRKRFDLKPIMLENKACEIKHFEQRAVCTTWKIKIRNLSDDACRTLNVSALCSKTEIGSKFLKKIVGEI